MGIEMEVPTSGVVELGETRAGQGGVQQQQPLFLSFVAAAPLLRPSAIPVCAYVHMHVYTYTNARRYVNGEAMAGVASCVCQAASCVCPTCAQTCDQLVHGPRPVLSRVSVSAAGYLGRGLARRGFPRLHYRLLTLCPGAYYLSPRTRMPRRLSACMPWHRTEQRDFNCRCRLRM